jgi:hypothetical protein
VHQLPALRQLVVSRELLRSGVAVDRDHLIRRVHRRRNTGRFAPLPEEIREAGRALTGYDEPRRRAEAVLGIDLPPDDALGPEG